MLIPARRTSPAPSHTNVPEYRAFVLSPTDGLHRVDGRSRKEPQLSRVLSLFAGLGVRLVVKALPKREKPPRPKLGRPLSSSKRRRETSGAARGKMACLNREICAELAQ